jgi:hypothetical protein
VTSEQVTQPGVSPDAKEDPIIIFPGLNNVIHFEGASSFHRDLMAVF